MTAKELLQNLLKEFPCFIEEHGEVNGGDLVDYMSKVIADYDEEHGDLIEP